MVSQNRKADLVGVVHAGFDVVSAALTDRIAAARPQAAIDLVDAGFELHADFLKPFDALRNVFTQCGDKSRVGAEIARSHRLFGMELRRVLNACFLVICFYGRIQAASANHSIAAWNGKFFQNDSICAFFLGDDAGRKTGTAGADDNDVIRFIPSGGRRAGICCMSECGNGGGSRGCTPNKK